ncbi:MAG: tyrosine-type recombinase/integrase [Terracidiphilus sp.]
MKRMYRLAYQASPPRVQSVPHFPHMKENNVRQGFVTPEQYAKLVTHCPDLWLRALLETACNYGWRVSVLLNLRVGQVDLLARTIRLDPSTTKNQEGREVTIEPGTLLQLLRHCVEGKRPEDHVFTRGDKPIRDFRKSWENLCTAAGVATLLFHDLRRTAARNPRAAGVAEEIIMRIAGWKTSNVFKRYAIVDKTDIRAALQQLERARQT